MQDAAAAAAAAAAANAGGPRAGDLNQQPLGLTVKAEEEIFLDAEGKQSRQKAGQTVMFKIGTSTKLRKLKRAWCTKVGVCPESVEFFHGGRTVEDQHSAADLFMLEGDLIFVKHLPTFLARNVAVASPRAREFEKLLESEAFSDLALLVGKERSRMAVHKCILAAMSPKFAAMFNTGFAEGNAAEIVLEAAEPRIMRLLLRYFYTDEVAVPEDPDEAAALLVLAEEYLVPGLKKACELALLGQVKERNVCTLFRIAHLHDAGFLKEKCKQYFLDHFDTKAFLGEELKKTPSLLLEITLAAVSGNKRRRLN
ncbi:hypothetical protein KFL_000200300 [Klebsormidium nitens]|uniref:BTB domain-containing protein n=1 Tax=Klebsormidium nitens TaxID=105231 RepID=A0A1Y1HST2_KLENI|nr:hypothetical protein KFL_000200300 [Klebsormidium nitens]|eukprot:GAQ78878.1 hypothetical protein KFL_000200300 [Klebsormidium nitens]